MTNMLFGMALGILLVIGSVKMGTASARWLWKHAAGLLVLGLVILASMALN